MIKIKRYMIGPLMANCYIVWSDLEHTGIMIDPGGWSDAIEKDIRQEQIQIKKILLTHGHYDHIAGLSEAVNYTKAKVYIHEQDAECLSSSGRNISLMLGQSKVFPPADVYLQGKEKIEVNSELTFSVLHTPVHTPGGVCYISDDMMFTGDTLFLGSVGRTDFPGGSYPEIIQSVKQLMEYPEDTVVYPGHGEKTTIRFEKKNNPYVQ
jgi:hydroxyacylglutathione hydrolase